MLLAAAFALVPAQAKSDFSGTWKANTAKSDFGPMPPPDSMVEKIVHQDPSLKVNVAQTGGQGDENYDLVFTTDGKECANSFGGNEFKTKMKWDGDDLVDDTTGSFGGTDFTTKDRWTLSDGGKTMTLTRHISTDGGDFDMKIVFDKQ
ncbi:MAG TPA: hypothetical protein VMI94_21925 [Bryobacteraceae bacterium]|nr:hypothetical protein [Bryobacteraceae bacterium]